MIQTKYTRNFLVVLLLVISIDGLAIKASELDPKILCNTTVMGIKIENGETPSQDVEHEVNLCILELAAKKAFGLTKKPEAPSRLELISKQVIAFCNVDLASEIVSGKTVKGEIQFMNQCFVEGISKKLKF